MSQAQAQAYDAERETSRVAAAARGLSRSLSDGDAAAVAETLAEALRWGRYDEASQEWRALRALLEEAAGRRGGGIEGHALGTLARAALALPGAGEAAPDGLLARISDVEELSRLVGERPPALPALSKEGRMADRLRQLAESLARLAQEETKERDTGGLRWLARWSSRLARAAKAVEEANGGANTIGILLDVVAPDEPVPTGAFDAPGVVESIAKTRGAVIQWLRSSKGIDVIAPRPLVDRAQGDLHDVEHQEAEGIEEGTVLRTTRLGWRVAARVERRAAVVAAKGRPSQEAARPVDQAPRPDLQRSEPTTREDLRAREP